MKRNEGCLSLIVALLLLLIVTIMRIGGLNDQEIVDTLNEMIYTFLKRMPE